MTFSQDWRTIETLKTLYTYKNGNEEEVEFDKNMYFRYENSAWEYISDGQKFEQVATNPTDRIWGVIDKWAGGY